MTTKLLTQEEWRAVKPPFVYSRVVGAMPAIQRQIIVKWIESHCGSSWVYWDGGEYYIFGSEGDWTIFQMWIKSDPFGSSDGEILLD